MTKKSSQGESEADYLELLLQKSVGNTLLFQSHIFSKPTRNQIIKQRSLVLFQSRKGGAARNVLASPKRTVRHQCLAIHQEGACVWESAPQAIKHGETMGIDVTPIVDMSS